MANRNTRSPTTGQNGEAKTSTHLSTNIIIKVDNFIVGAVQTLNITESRNIKMVSEVGTDGNIDSAPTSSTEISGTCNRIRFDNQRVAAAFGRGFIHVKSQRIPFDIEIHDSFADSDPGNKIITTLHQVWIKEISYDYSADNWIISDRMSFVAEDISSILANHNVITGVTGNQSGTIVLNQFEQQADRGLYRGALDAAGLLNAFISDPTS